MTNPEKQIKEEDLWAMAHGELTPERRAQVEKAMFSDSAIKKSFKEAQQLDAAMRRLLPAALLSDEDLEKTILAEFERDTHRSQVQNIRGVAESSAAYGERDTSKPIPAPVPSRNWMGWFALAACLLFVVGVYPRLGGDSLVWEETLIPSGLTRGAEQAESSPAPSQEASLKIGREIQSLVQTHYKAARSKPFFERSKPTWKLTPQVDNLGDGQIIVTVTAEHLPGKLTGQTWRETISDDSYFAANLEIFCKQIGEELAEAE